MLGLMMVGFKDVTCPSQLEYKHHGNERWCYNMAMKIVYLLTPRLEQMNKRYGIWTRCWHDLWLDVLLTTPKIHHLLLQFLLYTMMVFDEWYNGVHVAYIITSSYKQCHLAPWMDALNKRLLMFQSD
jgi:hypothetical protein